MLRRDANRLLDKIEFAFENHQQIQKNGQADFEVTSEMLDLIRDSISQIRQAVNKQKSISESW